MFPTDRSREARAGLWRGDCKGVTTGRKCLRGEGESIRNLAIQGDDMMMMMMSEK